MGDKIRAWALIWCRTGRTPGNVYFFGCLICGIPVVIGLMLMKENHIWSACIHRIITRLARFPYAFDTWKLLEQFKVCYMTLIRNSMSRVECFYGNLWLKCSLARYPQFFLRKSFVSRFVIYYGLLTRLIGTLVQVYLLFLISCIYIFSYVID